jgi:hypothetical protein
MSESRRQILQMLSDNKITADEAERLLAALDGPAHASAAANEPATPKNRPKYLRVLIEDRKNGERPTKVNIRVPMMLLRAGVRLSGLIPVQAREQMNEALRKQGVPFDVSQIRPENLDDLVDQLDDLSVDVNDETATVRVFTE